MTVSTLSAPPMAPECKSSVPQASNSAEAMESWMDEELEFLTDALFDGSLVIETPKVSSPTEADTRETMMVSPTSSVEDHITMDPLSSSSSSAHAAALAASTSEPMPNECWTEDVLSSAAAVAVSPCAAISSSPTSSAASAAATPLQLFGRTVSITKDASYIPIAPMPSTLRSLTPQVSDSLASSVVPKKNAARDMFLKAVAVAVAEQRVGPAAQQSKPKLTAEEQFNKQRERNRFLAKQTRERKKMTMASLKDQFLDLQRENQRLQKIAQENLVGSVQEAVLSQTHSALEKIPQVVWDACGGNGSECKGPGTKRKPSDTSCEPSSAQDEPLVEHEVVVSAPPSPKRQRVETTIEPPAPLAQPAPLAHPDLLVTNDTPMDLPQIDLETSMTDIQLEMTTDEDTKALTAFSIPNPLLSIG